MRDNSNHSMHGPSNNSMVTLNMGKNTSMGYLNQTNQRTAAVDNLQAYGHGISNDNQAKKKKRNTNSYSALQVNQQSG